MRFFYGTAATLQCRLTSVRVRGFRMIAVARRNCPVKPRGGTAIPKEKMRRYSNAPPVAELPADRKKFCKRRKSGVESNRGPRAKSLILAGANSMQRTAATAIFFCMLTLPHKCGVWRCYSNAPPVAELPLGSFLATQCSAPRDGVISLRFGEAHASRSRPET